MTLPGILWFVGMLFVFAGEQIVGEGIVRWIVDGIGLLLVLASLGLRARGLTSPDASVKDGTLKGLIAASVATLALVTYGLSTDDVTTSLGFAAESRARWQGVLGVLTPVILALGALPMVFVDQVLAANPVTLPKDAGKRSVSSGLYAALALALIFPVNYLFAHYAPAEIDTAYFRTTRVSVATRAAVQGLTEPLTVYVFFPPGNDVLAELDPYLHAIDEAGGDMVTVETLDQATAIGLAEELKLTSNGWIVIQQGEDGAPAKFKLREEKDKASRDLRRFDELFHKNLLKATRGQRLAYFVSGHGEASQRERDDDWRKISDLRKALQDQSYKLEDVSLVDGLAEEVPADADLLVIAGPVRPLLEGESASIVRWLKEGGELLVLLDARGNGVDGVLGPLGLEKTPGVIADFKRRVPGESPFLLVTNRYGTHAAVKELSQDRTPLPFAMAAGLRESGSEADGKRTVLVRSFGTAFADENLNGRQDANETAKVHNLAYAVEGGEGETEWRAVVIGNVQNMSNAATRRGWMQGQALALDSVRWLSGEEEFIGGTESEEDVKIDVTSGSRVWWFWGTIFAVPLLVLGGGLGWTMSRRRRQR